MAETADLYQTMRFGRYEERPPVYTLQDLAEIHGVSRQTIRNRLEDLKQKPGVREDFIGQARVLWYDSFADSRDREIPVEDFVQKNRQYSWKELLADRAKYLDLREELFRRLEEGDTLREERVVFIRQIQKYLYSATDWVNWGSGVLTELIRDGRELYCGDYQSSNIPEEIENEPYHLPGGTQLGEGGVDYYLFDAYLFTVPEHGTVDGLGEFSIPYIRTLKDALQDEDGNLDIERANSAAVEEHLPPTTALITAGDTVDEFVTELYGIEW
jgi:hypothetical protein